MIDANAQQNETGSEFTGRYGVITSGVNSRQLRGVRQSALSGQQRRPGQRTGLTLAGPARQRGASMFGIMLLVSLLIFAGMFAFKVVPAYLEYTTVADIADEAANNAQLMRSPKSKVEEYLTRAYRTNSLWDLNARETIHLKKDGKRGYLVTVDYEKRANLFANIDLVTHFHKVAGTP